jgi:hypothetical protein
MPCSRIVVTLTEAVFLQAVLQGSHWEGTFVGICASIEYQAVASTANLA